MSHACPSHGGLPSSTTRRACPESSAPYPGALATPRPVRAERLLSMAICTNKLERLSLTLLDRLELSPRFARHLRRRHVCVRKPDPRHLVETIPQGRRRPGARAHGRRFAHRHRHRQGRRHPGGRRRFRLHRSATCANSSPPHIISHYDELTLDLAERLLRAAEVMGGCDWRHRSHHS